MIKTLSLSEPKYLIHPLLILNIAVLRLRLLQKLLNLILGHGHPIGPHIVPKLAGEHKPIPFRIKYPKTLH